MIFGGILGFILGLGLAWLIHINYQNVLRESTARWMVTISRLKKELEQYKKKDNGTDDPFIKPTA